MDNLRVVDLFAGTGAFSHVLEKYGARTVFANDECQASERIYNLNHGTPLTPGNLLAIPVEDIPEHDVLCAGFPCQPFSIAGRREGFSDYRSDVFWKIIEILQRHQPGIVILENVRNLLSHNRGATFQRVTHAVHGAGYHLVWSLMNAQEHTGIPQNRERIFIVGFRDRDVARRYKNMGNFDAVPLRPIVDFLEGSVDKRYYYTERFGNYEAVRAGVQHHIDTGTVYQYRRKYIRENKGGVCPTLTANMGRGGHNVPLIRDDLGVRKLTPRECFNLQGFPPDYRLPDLSDVWLYKLAGNAVSVPVVALIVSHIHSALRKRKQRRQRARNPQPGPHHDPLYPSPMISLSHRQILQITLQFANPNTIG